jgi:hypothetical protein
LILAEFSSAISVEALPKTFVDAIQLTYDLAIPYIWIDALCIVQDDPQEWQSEAGRMESVYMGSQLTISAVQSSNGSQGCFRSDINGYLKGEVLLQTVSEDGDEPDLLVRIYRVDIRNRATTNSALSTRGWTLQEQLLSKRVISCMRTELHWFCRHHHAVENGLHFSQFHASSDGWPLPVLYTQTQWSSAAAGEVSWHRKWAGIVEQYSQREFTFPQDRIAAIAGIINYIAPHLGDESILGLWKNSLTQTLGWMRISRPPDPAFHSLAESLPSWTWLACRESVYDFWGWEH